VRLVVELSQAAVRALIGASLIGIPQVLEVWGEMLWGAAARVAAQPSHWPSTLHAAYERLQQDFENHCAAIMLWFAFYNFCRVHKSLRVTPAMAVGSPITCGA
jgi:hypothetical protein